MEKTNMKEMPCSAYAYHLQCEKEAIARKEKERHETTMESAARAVQEQNKLLQNQLTELKTQNRLLCQQSEQARLDAIETKKEARRNKIFAWVSFGVGTLIGIAGVVVGIIL